MRLDNVLLPADSVPAWLVPVILAATVALDALDGMHTRRLPVLPVAPLECLAVCQEQGAPMQSVGPEGCACGPREPDGGEG